MSKVDTTHGGSGRPFAERDHERLESSIGPLGHDGHAAIPVVDDPAAETEPSGFALHEPAEAHTLDEAVHRGHEAAAA
jgi:hypothetical protein